MVLLEGVQLSCIKDGAFPFELLEDNRIDIRWVFGDIDAAGLDHEQSVGLCVPLSVLSVYEGPEVLQKDGRLVALGDILVNDIDRTDERCIGIGTMGGPQYWDHVLDSFASCNEVPKASLRYLDAIDHAILTNIRYMSSGRTVSSTKIKDI
jgi:hypothetical protein